jgi:hypothetical protein
VSACAALSLCRAGLLAGKASSLPEKVFISTGRSRQRDQVSGILRDSLLALLGGSGKPFALSAQQSTQSSSQQSSLGSKASDEAGGSNSGKVASAADGAGNKGSEEAGPAPAARLGSSSSGSSASKVAAGSGASSAGSNGTKLEASGALLKAWLEKVRTWV